MLKDSELLNIQKPAQYLGGEIGSINKGNSQIELNFCLAFPDTYEVGMSHIGFQILYDLINRDAKSWAERVYMPLPDMEKLLRDKKMHLSSLEGKRPLHEFDVVGFSLQYELCMTGILSILDLGGIPILAKDRTEAHPIIIGGGPVVYHPEPFADFFDAFLVGDGEELVPEFNQKIIECKKLALSRADTLKAISQIPGVYLPAMYEEGKTFIKRRIISTLVGAPYPTSPVVPNIKAVHDRLSVEVMRGCVRGCRFCQAGYLYRPQRERSPEDVLKIVGDSLKNTGYEELSLLSLSTADYCSILPLLSSIKERYAKNDELAVSFPSTRVDALKPELLEEVQSIRRSGFTIAPEAGTQRLRDVINKGVTDEEIMETCRNVYRLGWSSVKMYFMIGLPTETMEDIDGIISLGRRVKQIAGYSNDVTVSVSTLVPKPHTPFQWAAQISEQETKEKQWRIADGLKGSRVNFRYHYAFSTFLEGVFARGGRELGEVIINAFKAGCRLEGWTEKLTVDKWLKAFSDSGIEPANYLRERSVEEPLPWDHISCDIPKTYFKKEWERALRVKTTPDCLTETCSICGACDYDSTKNELFERTRTQKRLNIINPRWERPRDEISPEAAQPVAVKKERAGKYDLKEYLRTETDTSLGARELALPVVQRVRLSYTKIANAKFFAHLEMSSVFFRAMRRASIPIAFSRGFNPKPRIIFGPPLQLGLESRCEFVDIFLTEKLPDEKIQFLFLEHLNPLLPNGLEILKAYEVEQNASAIQSSISKQTFKIEFSAPPAGFNIKALEDETFWKEKILRRERKGKAADVKLGDYIEKVIVGENSVNFNLVYSNNGGSLKPSEIAACLTEAPPEEYKISKLQTEFLL
jgi:radical SAM family uncharacterized protein/radical SAM-linked protein